MESNNFLDKQESNIAINVFDVSLGMIGVCFTVIGIINFVGNKRTIADEITAWDDFISHNVLSRFEDQRSGKKGFIGEKGGYGLYFRAHFDDGNLFVCRV
jgi:hypothetical protein